MANDLTKNPWIIDTAGAGALTTLNAKIKGFRWVSAAAAAGHACVVQDQNSRTIWESVAAGANHVDADTFDSTDTVSGIKVPTLASGKLYIEFAHVPR